MVGLLAVGGCQRTRPPAADCDAVAASLVSLELGNYVPREERVAALPVKRALCEQQRITVAEAACLAKASDPWSAATCVPRMYPEAVGGDCAAVTEKMRVLFGGMAGSDPSQQAMVDKALAMVRTSCNDDHWPEALRRCILSAKSGDAAALGACEKITPPELKAKLQQRMMTLAR